MMNYGLKRSLEDFKEFLKGMEHDFMVVGSVALKMQGVSFGREPDDIDVEVKIKEGGASEAVYVALAKAAGNNFYEIQEAYPENGWSHKPYIFEFLGMRYNVWIVEEFTHKIFVYNNYVKYAGVGSVLKAKAVYKRKKDYADFNYLISELSNLMRDVK